MSTVTYTEPIVAFPSAGDAEWDAVYQEWVLTDSDGISYFGDTPGQCYTRFHEALHLLAAHMRKSGDDLAFIQAIRRL